MRTLTTQETRAAAGGTLCLPSLFSLLLCAKISLPKLPRHSCTTPTVPKCDPKPRCGTDPVTDPGTDDGEIS
ncbi:MAG: hypothetical protein RI907_2066 [Pseudomonadota bacterium]|jgi:hypothetical protein